MLKHNPIVPVVTIFAGLVLSACGANAPAVPSTVAPQATRVAMQPTSAVRPTTAPQPSAPLSAVTAPQPAPTALPPTDTPPPATPTIPLSTLVAQLSGTVAASLPRTPTPKAGERPFGGPTNVSVLPLKAEAPNSPALYAVYTVGIRSFQPVETRHFVAVYALNNGLWQQLARQDLEIADYVNEKSVQQVQIAPGRTWISIDSGVGAHGGCYDLLSFDGKTLKNEVSQCGESPGVGSVKDVNGDGINDVVLDATDSYIFCYACGVRLVNYSVLSWDGSKMVTETLKMLPDSAPADLRKGVNRAMELAQAGLYKEALATISQTATSTVSDPVTAWDSGLIRLTAEGRVKRAGEGFPLLANIFYGDYPTALNVMRKYPAAQLFTLKSPLIVATPAENFSKELTDWVTMTTTSALKAQPDLAAAYYLRGWALYLKNPANPAVRTDLQKAAQLDPKETLYTQALTFVKK